MDEYLNYFNIQFIDYCNKHKILFIILFLHFTH